MSKKKSPGAVAALGAFEIDRLAGRVTSETRLDQTATQVAIYAVLVGSDRCEGEGIIARGSAPVLALCRELIKAGHVPANPLEVWRGDTLALRVRAIGEGARLRIATHGVGFEAITGRTRRPPVRKNGTPHIQAGRERQRGYARRAAQA